MPKLTVAMSRCAVLRFTRSASVPVAAYSRTLVSRKQSTLMQVVAGPGLFSDLHATLLRQFAHPLQRVARSLFLAHEVGEMGADDGVDRGATLGGDLAR